MWKMARNINLAHYVLPTGRGACGFFRKRGGWDRDADLNHDRRCKECKKVISYLIEREPLRGHSISAFAFVDEEPVPAG